MPLVGAYSVPEEQLDVSLPPSPSLADHPRGSTAGAARDEDPRLPARRQSRRPLPKRSSLHDDLATRGVLEVDPLRLVEDPALPRGQALVDRDAREGGRPEQRR